MWEKYQRARKLIAHWILIVCCRNGRLASLYYCVFSKHFDHEHLAVLRGKRAYLDSLGSITTSSALLRRNIHRLEKGLIMKPRRPIFAEDFIRETVVCYGRALESEAFFASEEKWARDVLDEYFSVTGSSAIIDAARDDYRALRSAKPVVQGRGAYYKPYEHSTLPESQVGFDELQQLYVRRRSVRWFKQQPVPIDMIRKAIDIAALAPSACNRQSYKFLITTSQDKAGQIADCAGGTAGFSGNIPAIIVVVGDLSSYPFERDRHLIYIDPSLAAMQLMLALEVQGLSTCPINWPDLQSSEEKIRSILDLPDYDRIVMLMAVGYADSSGGVAFSQKKTGTAIMEELQ